MPTCSWEAERTRREAKTLAWNRASREQLIPRRWCEANIGPGPQYFVFLPPARPFSGPTLLIFCWRRFRRCFLRQLCLRRPAVGICIAAQSRVTHLSNIDGGDQWQRLPRATCNLLVADCSWINQQLSLFRVIGETACLPWTPDPRQVLSAPGGGCLPEPSFQATGRTL